MTYSPGTTDEAGLREQMRGIVNHAADRGLMTGETDAEVLKWDAEVTTVRSQRRKGAKQ